jgi:hypothetical protein
MYLKLHVFVLRVVCPFTRREGIEEWRFSSSHSKTWRFTELCGQLHTPGKTLSFFTTVKGFVSGSHIWHIHRISLKSSTYKRDASKTSWRIKKCMARRGTETSQGFGSMCDIYEEIHVKEKSFPPLHFTVWVELPLCHHWLLYLINEYDHYSVSINWLYGPCRTFASLRINFQASLFLLSLLPLLHPFFHIIYKILKTTLYWLSNGNLSFSDVLKHFLHSPFFLWQNVKFWRIQ